MDETISISSIDQKMAEMRIKNLELLKRHQEIEEDRQLAERLGVTKNMRGATKNRARLNTNQQNCQENQHERIHRPPVRRKFENDRNDNQPQRAQRVDYNRLKRERAQEIKSSNSINPELHEYAYPFHCQSDNTNNNNDADEPAHAKKLVIVNNKVDRIGSGRFSQQQRTQEHGQRKREEKMRRCTVQNNGHTGGANEFHIDVPPMPIWQNGPMPPVHVQIVPTNINNHHAGIDHLINTSGDQMDQSPYIHNFVYPSPASPFNGNGTVYFAHPPMNTPPPSSQTHFHQYHQARTFENSNRHQFHLSPIFQPPTPVSATLNNQPEMSPTDFSPRFRHHENKLSQQRPMSGDFERLHNSHQSRGFQHRPQSFYDFSLHQQSNNNNHFLRSSNNNRHQRNNNNNTSLPLSAYMNTDDSLNQNENISNNNHWSASNQRRRPAQQQRIHHQDKHQFPLSSYDPRQYGFNNNYQRRNDNRSNINRRNMNNNHHNNNRTNDSNDIDLIEEWWEDNNTELIGTNPSTLNTDSKLTTIDDSGNSSLSTSMNLKEIPSDDFVNPPSDVSTTDSNIIESLDKLQQQLKLEEAVDERLASTHNENTAIIDNKSKNEPATYDTAHFMQWAKEKFREELAGRLTAQEIQQHDAAATDDDDDEDSEHQSTTNTVEKIDAFEKLTIDENLPNINKSIVVE